MKIYYRPTVISTIGLALFLYYFLRLITFVDQGNGDSYREIKYEFAIYYLFQAISWDLIIQKIRGKKQSSKSTIIINSIEAVLLILILIIINL